MMESTFSRRILLRNLVRSGFLGSTAILFQGCKRAELRCEDTTGLQPEDRELRAALEYRDRSPYDELKNCANCAFYVAADADQCGQCTLLKGPIHPLGYCDSWATKG